MLSQSTPVRNCLLGLLPPDVLTALSSKLSRVTLASRQPLYRMDAAIEAVYFVEAGMVSLVATLDDGMQAEVGIVGYEGMLGVSLVSGESVSFIDSMVQMPGEALRMTAREFRRELVANEAF